MSGQGVGYLDDGTMVVVDQGKKGIGRTIEVTVTSVLQTTAGKMIFCRWPEMSADDSGARRERSRERNGRAREPDANGVVAEPGEIAHGGDGPEEPSVVHSRSASKAN